MLMVSLLESLKGGFCFCSLLVQVTEHCNSGWVCCSVLSSLVWILKVGLLSPRRVSVCHCLLDEKPLWKKLVCGTSLSWQRWEAPWNPNQLLIQGIALLPWLQVLCFQAKSLQPESIPNLLLTSVARHHRGTFSKAGFAQTRPATVQWSCER